MSERSEESSSSAAGDVRKNACVVFDGWKIGTDDRNIKWHEYQIYVVDCCVSCDEFTHIKPTFILDWDNMLAICGLDSTLYVFEGHDSLRGFGRRYAGKYEIPPRIQLLPHQSSECKLSKDQLFELQPMNYEKCFPAALPTPDGKSILVFSRRINDDITATFELYDVDSGSWDPLPKFPFITDDDIWHVINKYGFKTENHFVVETSDEYMLALDITGKDWKELGGSEIDSAGPYFIGINDEVFFSRHSVIDYVTRESCKLPKSVLPQHDPDSIFYHYSFGTLLDDHHDGIYYTCFAQVDLYEDKNQYARKCRHTKKLEDGSCCLQDMCLLMDICCTSIDRFETDVKTDKKPGKYKRHKKRKPVRTTRVKTLKFMVSVNHGAFGSLSMRLFSI